jgi:hypothetical protein
MVFDGQAVLSLQLRRFEVGYSLYAKDGERSKVAVVCVFTLVIFFAVAFVSLFIFSFSGPSRRGTSACAERPEGFASRHCAHLLQTSTWYCVPVARC